jgi:hypothetical protein
MALGNRNCIKKVATLVVQPRAGAFVPIDHTLPFAKAHDNDWATLVAWYGLGVNTTKALYLTPRQATQ